MKMTSFSFDSSSGIFGIINDIIGREPWSSGYGRRLAFQRS